MITLCRTTKEKAHQASSFKSLVNSPREVASPRVLGKAREWVREFQSSSQDLGPLRRKVIAIASLSTWLVGAVSLNLGITAKLASMDA